MCVMTLIVITSGKLNDHFTYERGYFLSLTQTADDIHLPYHD
jgi:hypothetical protein